MHLLKLAVFALTAVAALSGPSQAEDRRITVQNDTGFSIVKFYGSKDGSADWQENILGQSVLASGSAVKIDFDDGTGTCVFDFRVVFDDGDELVKKAVNVCEVSTLAYN
jgi:hypothetical protein